MLKAPIYINGLGNISPQKTTDNALFLDEIVTSSDNFLKCIEPSYKEHISPTQLRRMSHILKMGMVASKFCLQDSHIEMPDGIIIGTGLGCIEDTEKFLYNVLTTEEELFSPTSFIQSTHNTIGAHIALMLSCNAYNNTFVHRGFSFESAVIDAVMLLQEGSYYSNILVGGIDEVTQNSYKILKSIGDWKKEPIFSLDLLKHKTKGSIAGEGAVFFMLGNQLTPNTYGQIKAIKTLYDPSDMIASDNAIKSLLIQAQLTMEDIDLVLLGLNGNDKEDQIYYSLAGTVFKNTNQAYFKHLSGEYHTASAFALWLSAKILKTQKVPDVCYLNHLDDRPVRNILIYNHYFHINHTMFIVSV